ncbi:ankyrin repeat and protein kinase domain-containing protein 1 isoform X2 [Nematostella vectensis]|uniref:ankyrin repeat and protein kinase domain-containing protein 1 isoform X2 n=1 Tax=Nematostella vectensis TaxID=45351 RepID=UPI001390595D|nr:ankyrin repeat and protein kinase domain-containing protein 1 isoform X2 [Nematostella vectensis]
MGQRYTLFFTSREGREEDLKWALHDRRISPNLRDPESKQTALHVAAAKGRAGCVKLLIEAGASVDVKEKDGLTPLHLAVYHGNSNCVQILIDYGADVNSTSRFGSTPLHQASYFGHLSCAQILLKNGAFVDVEEAWGQTPLFLAAQRAHSNVVQLLLQYNAYVKQTDKAHFKTALHVACEAQSIACVQYLLDAGADPNAQCANGRTPMHEVVTSEEVEPITHLLVEYGARCDITDNTDSTPVLGLEALMLRHSNDTNPEHFLRYQGLLEFLWHAHGQPKSLMQMCRGTLRKVFSPSHLHLVNELDIPTCLKRYILNIVDDETSNKL